MKIKKLKKLMKNHCAREVITGKRGSLENPSWKTNDHTASVCVMEI